jgi:predicted AlkP superfamily pyrophosphatase or phosphodiesterase
MKLRSPVIVAVAVFISGAIIFLSCGRLFKPAVPRLAVVIVVDQMRYDYLVRFAGLFTGGFAKLLREGAVFTNAHHDHAGTETAPGHATLATGSYPSHHGIVGNGWFNRPTSQRVYCVDDANFALVGSEKTNIAAKPSGKSPHQLLRRGLGDWLKAKYPQAKVISVAGKDRSAILMGGFEADAAYWFLTASGGFVSSRYYREALPEWAAQWNNERQAERFYSKAWEKIRPEEDYFVSREDLFDAEGDGENTTFPHEFIGADSSQPQIEARFYQWLAATPALDALTLSFARQAVTAEALGADGTPDLLFIGLAGTDYIGHAYGPLSQESEDNFLRLDTELANFFDFLDQKVGLKNCVLALSADHGVLPLPEELRRRGFESARILQEEAIAEVQGLERELQQEWRTKRQIFRSYLYQINLDFQVADSLGLSHHEFRSHLAAKLRTLSFVSDIFTYDELSATGGSARDFLEKYRHSFYPERAQDLVMQMKPHYLVTNSSHGTTHGSSYEYDTHVPLIFWGERIKPGRIDTLHKTVDLAPTLAHLLNLDLPADLQRRVANGRAGSAQIESGVDGEVLLMAIKK